MLGKFDAIDLRKFVILPIVFGFLAYAFLKLSYYIFLVIFGHPGLAFVFEIITFTLISSLLAPKIIHIHYGEEFWKIVKITKQHWLGVVSFSVLASILFVSHDTIFLFSIEFSRSGLGALSFGSLVQAPIFEEFLFRGVILGLSLRLLDEEFAAILNGVLFGIWHVGAYLKYGFELEVTLLVVTTTLFGYILAKIQYRRENLVIPIILHSIATLFVALTGFPIDTTS